jgi:hypothetical protein
MRRKIKLTRLASGFVFLLAKPKFHSHLTSWGVVIRIAAFLFSGFHTVKANYRKPESVIRRFMGNIASKGL